MKEKVCRYAQKGLFAAMLFAYQAGIPMEVAEGGGAAAGGRSLTIRQGGSALYLSLPGIEDAVYDIQVATNLTSNVWKPLAPVTGADGETVYPLPTDESVGRFFRVLFPSPVVIAGEPALVSEPDGEALYITGQYFYPGDCVRIGGVLLENAVFASSALLRVALPALPPGLHDVEVLNGRTGRLLAFLPGAIEVSPSPQRTLQGPPEWPPAGPAPAAHHRGHVTVLKSHGDDCDDEDPRDFPEGVMSPVDGHVTVLKSHGGGGGGGAGGMVALRISKKGYDFYMASTGKRGYDYYQARASKKGYDYYQAKSDVSAASVAGGPGDGVDDDCDGIIPASQTEGSLEVVAKIGDSATLLRLHSGELCHQAVDLELPGRGLDFVWTRTYRSRTGPDSSQGTRWTHGYDVRCVANSNTVEVFDGTGRSDTLRLQPDGTYTCPGLFREGTFTGGVFRLTFADTGFWEFNPFDRTPTAGRLARVQDRNWNAMILNYNQSGQLQTVTDTLGRVHTVAYTPEGRIASVTDSTGRTVTYAYYSDSEIGGALGDLKSVTSPSVTGTPNGNDFRDGKTVTYTYRASHADNRLNHLLLTVTDGRGNTAATFTYDTDPASPSLYRCVSAQCGTEVQTRVTYHAQTASPDNGFAVMRAIVNDPVGNVTESFFDIRNRCVTLREFTGRAKPGVPVTDEANRPAGRLRPKGPDFYETGMRWNNDNLCTRLALASGLVGTFVYGGDANVICRIRKRPDLLIQEWDARAVGGADVDGDGRPDIAVISRRYTYDPRFGQDPGCPSAQLGRDRTAVLSLACTGGPGDESLDRGGREQGTSQSTGARSHKKRSMASDLTDFDRTFVISFADPLGTVTTAEYDDRGNCTRVVTPFTDGSGRQVVRTAAYDAHGQRVEVTHPKDAADRRRTDTITWNNGLPSVVVCDDDVEGLRLTTSFEYDERGNLTRLIDPRSNDVLVAYNALNQPVTFSRQSQGPDFGERVATAYFYDANDNLVQVDMDNRDAEGTLDPVNPQWSTWLSYDALNRPRLIAHELTHVVQQRVMTNEFVYDAAGRLVLHRLPEAVSGADPNNTVAFAYDERGLLLRCECAPGTGLSSVDTFDYNANGNLVRVTRADASATKETTCAYDGFGRCVRLTDAMGNVVTRCFDANGNLTYERADGEVADQPGDKGNITLAETRYRYDHLNRLTGQVDSFFDIFTGVPFGDGASSSSWSYAPDGQLTSVSDDNSNTTFYAYDRAGRFASITDPAGNVTAYAYDPNGNVLTVTRTERAAGVPGEQVFVTACAYDSLNRCVSVSDNVGNTVAREYDSCGNVVSETDARGNETVCVYDGLGRMLTAVRYLDEKERGVTINTSHVEYRNRRLVSTTDGNGQTTTFEYDACDRLALTTCPDGTSESFVWSPRSNLRVHTDANGTVVTNTYDFRERIIHRDIAARNVLLASTTFESFGYDGLGRLVSAENDVSRLAYAYDSLGNRISSSQDGRVTTASFDGVGNRLAFTCPSGIVVSVSHDALNRPASVSARMSADGEPAVGVSFTYDGPNRLAGITRANGVSTRLLWNGQQGRKSAPGDFGWGLVSGIRHARTNDGVVIDQRLKTYDRDQNKASDAMGTAWYDGGPLVTNVYGYDRMHRLTRSSRSSATVTNTVDYVFDPNGNRLVVTNGRRRDVYVMDASMPEPADFQMNQYTVTPYGTNAYDARGNLVNRSNASQSVFYHFDHANRLIQVDAPGAVGTPEPVAVYSYDPLGRRISKKVFTADGLPPVTTTYVYDDTDNDCDGDVDDDALEVYADGTLRRTFILPHVLETRAGREFVHEANVMARVMIDDEGHVLYFHEDELGNTLALTDRQGQVIERYAYDDYGSPTILTADGVPLAQSVVGNDILFHGMRWDLETGLYAGHSQAGTVGPVPWMAPESLSRSAGTNPAFQDNNMSGNMPLYTALTTGGGLDFFECWPCTYMDPRTGQTLSGAGRPSSWGGSNARAFAGSNPTSLRKEEGGRHTPFHNKLAVSGNDPVVRVVRKRPGRVKYGDITLKRGYVTVSAASSVRHDVAMNSIRNMR